jgi:hypothetical protein
VGTITQAWELYNTDNADNAASEGAPEVSPTRLDDTLGDELQDDFVSSEALLCVLQDSHRASSPSAL